MAEQIQEKKTWISLVAVVAAIGVVYLHVNGCFWNYSTESYWISANIIETLFYASVPLFFMVSGATLLDYPKRYTTATYFYKRINKTVIPYFAWAAIYFILYGLTHHTLGINSIAEYAVKSLDGSVWGTFWFFPILFAVYMIIPVFANIEQEKKITIYSYTCVIIVIMSFAIPLINNAFGCNIAFLQYRSGIEIYVAYALMGYLLGHSDLKKPYRIAVYIVSLSAFLIMLIGTYQLSIEIGEVSTRYKGYTTIECFAYAIGLYIFLKECGKRLSEDISKIVNIIKDYTFGIFLIHSLVITLMVKGMDIVGASTTNLIYRLIAPLFVIAICMCVIRIIRCIPGVRRVVPK